MVKLREWIELFIKDHPPKGDISKLDLEFGRVLIPSLIVTDGEDGPMMALGMSLVLSHIAKWGLPTDLSEWLVEAPDAWSTGYTDDF